MLNSWPCMGGGGGASAVCDLAIAAPSTTAIAATRNLRPIFFINSELLQNEFPPGTWAILRTLIETRLRQKSGKKSVNPSKVLSNTTRFGNHRGLTILYGCRPAVWCTMQAGKMERILVIDDDVELCTLVGEYLQAEG